MGSSWRQPRSRVTLIMSSESGSRRAKHEDLVRIIREERLESGHDLVAEPVVLGVGLRHRVMPLDVHAVVQKEVGLDVRVTTDHGERLAGELSDEPPLVEDAAAVEVEDPAPVVEDHRRVGAEALDPGGGRSPHASGGHAHTDAARADTGDSPAYSRGDPKAFGPRRTVEIGDDQAIGHGTPSWHDTADARGRQPPILLAIC